MIEMIRGTVDVIDITVEVVYWIVTLPFRLLRGIFDSSSPDIIP
jgi:hypothetical protein